MSRCFPYPPPGCVGSSANGDALILSIKLQQERERPKSEKKKDSKREKKERKRNEKKANETLCSENNFVEGKLHLADRHGEILHEHVERSTLTEEHGRPCCSSESTENSTKRKRQSPVPASNITQKQGTVIRFRLSSQKKEEPPTTYSNHAAPCSTSGRPDSVTQKADLSVKQRVTPNMMRNATTRPVSVINKEATTRPVSVLNKDATTRPVSVLNKEATAQPISVLGKETTTRPVSALNKEAPLCLDKEAHKRFTPKGEIKLPKALRRYRALVDNWAAPLEPETVADEQEWLFASKQEVSQPAKKLKCCKEEVPSCASHPWQSQAQLLGDADIYALPYAVPF